MTLFQAARRLLIRLLDRIIPMEKKFKAPRFVDRDNGRAVYLYTERVSGRMMMAHTCVSPFRVQHHECEQFEVETEF